VELQEISEYICHKSILIKCKIPAVVIEILSKPWVQLCFGEHNGKQWQRAAEQRKKHLESQQIIT